jgi:hypothetical protein
VREGAGEGEERRGEGARGARVDRRRGFEIRPANLRRGSACGSSFRQFRDVPSNPRCCHAGAGTRLRACESVRERERMCVCVCVECVASTAAAAVIIMSSSGGIIDWIGVGCHDREVEYTIWFAAVLGGRGGGDERARIYVLLSDV